MSSRIIREYGDEILKKKSKDVVELTDRIKELIVDMKQTMIENRGCGLAAVQVGVLRNIIVVQEDDKKPVYTFINPKILEMSEKKEKSVEGCLSVKGKKGIVERATKIKFEALDENMQLKTYVAEGFFARIIQHEIDHLFGELYTEKIEGRLYKSGERIPGFDKDDEDDKNVEEKD